jgi:3-oxoacyl-[acyl-carrier-protein] synthase II
MSGTVAPLAITGCGVVAPTGVGRAELITAIRDGFDGYVQPTPGTGDYPPIPLWAVPDLPVGELLGRKGLRNVDRMTVLALVAVKFALEEAGGVAEDELRSSGVVLATATGSLRSLTYVAMDTVIQEKPYMVNPARFPNVVMNACAGQIAIRTGMRGLNATVSAGQTSSMAAFRYARIAMAQGRATRLLTGGVEELSPIGVWGWHLAHGLTDGVAAGEGAAMFMVEDAAVVRAAGRPILAEVLACETGFAADGVADQLVDCIDRALRRSGCSAGDLDTVVLGAGGQPDVEQIEQEAVEKALGRPVERLPVTDTIGQCYSASGALGVAALLGHWADRTGWTGLVTSAGSDGNVGALVVRGTAS